MKKYGLLLGFLALVLVIAGCQNMGPKTTTGAVVGGLIGATAGGIIGHQSGHGLEGAGIGAAVGALGGGLLGHSWDQKDKQALQANPQHITVAQIADMAQKGATDDYIIAEINRTHSTYLLDSEGIAFLKQNKVSDKVIGYMQATAK